MGYGSWINNVINSGKKKVQEAVNGAVQTGQNVVNNVVNTAQNAVGNAVNTAGQVVQNVASGYGDWVSQGQEVVNGAVQTGQNVVNNAIQTGQQVATDYYNNTVVPTANQAVQAGQQAATDYYNNTVVPTVNQAVETGKQAATDYYNNTVVPTVNNAVGQAAQNVTDTVNNVNGQIQQATGNAPTEQTPVQPSVQQTPTQTAPATGNNDHIYSFEEFEQATSGGAASTDATNKETLSEIDNLKAVGDETAKGIYDTTNKTLEGIKQDIYNYADSQLNSSLGYNQEAYDKIVTNIMAQYEAGKLNAEETKQMILLAAEEAKNLTYASAERQRQEAETMADLQRQRAIADANSAYEQNKTGYGAKAEALGDMGLTGGGYSDWLEASAYAQNRAETQAARAQSDTTKREAKYKEDQTKLAADLEKSDKELQAQLDYLGKMYDIDTSYRSSMSDAEQSKLAADKAAQETAAGLKVEADTAHKQGQLENESSYLSQLFDNLKYYSEGKEQSESNKLAYYELLMQGANGGKYSADFLNTMADELGFSQEWKDALINAETEYKNKTSGAEDQANAEATSQKYATLLTQVSEGAYTKDVALALAKEFGLNENQIAEITKAADAYATEKGNAESKLEAEQNVKNFAGLIDNIRNGAFNGYTDEELASLASEMGITLTDSQKKLVEATRKLANGDVDASDNEYKIGVYSELLTGAKNGTYTAEELADFAKRFGLDEGMANMLSKAAESYATSTGNAEDSAAAEQKRSDFINILSDIKMGAFNSGEIDAIAKQFGFDANDPADAEMIQMFRDAAKAYEDGADEMDENTKISIYSELLMGAKSGAYTEAEIADFAKRFGLDDTMTSNLTTAVKDYNTKVSEAEAEQNEANKTTNFVNMLNDVKNGAYTKDEIAEIAAQLGFKAAEGEEGTDGYKANDQKLIDMLTKAAERYEAGVAEDDAATKTANFVDLLGMVNGGQLTKAEAAEIAKQLGFDKTKDKTSLDLLNTAADRYASGTEEDKKAAKTANFIALLDGANTGAYDADQIAEIAKQFGFDANKPEDKTLIDMLTKAADGFASEETAAALKADKQYMNGIYAELLSAANNGDYDAEDIKDLAAKFGFEETDQAKLAKAAEKYAKNKAAEELKLEKGQSADNKLQIESTLTSDTTDAKIDEYVDAEYITEEDGEKLKQDRNNIAKQEISDMIKGGDYTGAVERAEELKKSGVIDEDTYQNTHFEVQKNNCSQVKTVDDIKSMEAELKNALDAKEISQADYDSLTKYMYESLGGKLNADKYTAELKTSGMSVTAKIQIGNTTYNSNLNKKADDDTISTLNKIANSGDTLVMLDGTLYFKSTLGWYSLKNNKGLYEAYNKQLSYQPKVKAPEHMSTN